MKIGNKFNFSELNPIKGRISILELAPYVVHDFSAPVRAFQTIMYIGNMPLLSSVVVKVHNLMQLEHTAVSARNII